MRFINSIKKFGNYRITGHILFWIAFVIVFGVPYCSLEGDCLTMIFDILILMPVKMAAVYFTIYYLLPFFLIQKKYVRFFLLFFLSAIIFGLLHRTLQFYIIGPLYYPETYLGWHFWNKSYILYGILSIYTVVAVATAIKLLKQSYQNQKLNQQLVNEKLEAELNMLKAQIHPHFLFNTLNNIYALALEKSEATAEGILKLSDLLDYMLYDCNVPFIALDKEIKLINDYIELEKLRYGKRLKVNMQVTGNTSGKQIAPMLILPFVENSFKHGSSKELNETRINIDLKVALNAIDLRVENSRSNSRVKDNNGYSEGIGLNNVKRRLELIYKGKYQLEINANEGLFKIHLHLEL